uniref:Uncharacterized protein n=1 Tax=Romanomermis culicivorax TaxID=13658 RepID=A0A915KE89_ROMCU
MVGEKGWSRKRDGREMEMLNQTVQHSFRNDRCSDPMEAEPSWRIFRNFTLTFRHGNQKCHFHRPNLNGEISGFRSKARFFGSDGRSITILRPLLLTKKSSAAAGNPINWTLRILGRRRFSAVKKLSGPVAIPSSL